MGLPLNWLEKMKPQPSSFRNAIYLAIDAFRNRELYREISKDPLTPGSTPTNGKDESPEDLDRNS